MKNYADVCLVSMPHADPQIPSLALGLLQGTLIKNGIMTKSIYANLIYAERTGIELYKKSYFGNPNAPISEWLFSSSAFPNFSRDDNGFIKEMYKILGCTSSLSQKISSLALLRKIKELNPKIITIMGGADCETVMGLAIVQYFPWIDYAISGEGEDLIVPLIKKIFEFGCDVPLQNLPKGVVNSKYSGDEPHRAVANSFNNQIMPVYEDYFEQLNELPDSYKNFTPTLPIQSSRGCWHGKCKFCGLNAPQVPYRSRPWKLVLEELEYLSNLYGINKFEFLDNILDMKYFDEFIPELINLKAPYKLFYEIRSNLGKSHFEMLKMAGITKCQTGIESLSSEALKEMGKGVTAWQNIQTLKWGKKFGIHLYWAILHNFPGDKDKWYKKMAELIPLIAHFQPPNGDINVNYQRYSHYFDKKNEYNLDLITNPIYSHIYPLKDEEIKNVSYTFQDRFYSETIENPQMAVLFNRPGLEKLQSAIYDWKNLYMEKCEPVLSMKVESDEIIIKDTRPISLSKDFILSGMKKEIYFECDTAIKESDLYSRFKEKGNSEADIESSLEFLVYNKLIAKIDDRFLALAIEE